MNTSAKIATGVCTFSTLFTGCYTSSMIDIAGGEREKIYSNDITSVLTKDGKKYEFEKPPVIVNDTIVGAARFIWYTQVNQEETSIPLSNIASRGESHSGNIEYVVTNTGAKYTYEEPPAVVNRVVIGKAKFTGYMSVAKGQVSIPLSDVAEMSVSEISAWRTLGAVTLVAAVVVGIVAAASSTVHVGPVFTSIY